MRKTDKKIDKQLSAVLTEVCETALKEFSGFEWLTHLVNFENFPQSLKVVCVFDTNDNLARYQQANSPQIMSTQIQAKLLSIGVKVNNMAEHIYYDTEENCEQKNKGQWADRLSRLR